MLIDEIKKASMKALKEKDTATRNALSAVISRYGIMATSGNGKEVSDADVIRIITKVDRELDEEIASYEAAGRLEQAEAVKAQKAALKPYIPSLMGEEEIKAIILTLEDRAVPAVMKHFKTHYAGRVDMGTVNKVLKSL